MITTRRFAPAAAGLLLSAALLQGCDSRTPLESAASRPLAASAPGTFAPPPPVGVNTAFQADSFAVEVTWSHDGTQLASRWRLERLDVDSAWTQVAADSGVGGRYLDASFPVGPARTLEYRVLVCNDAGCGTSSPTPAAVPALPAPVSVTAVADLDSIVVAWNQPGATAWITQVARRTASTGYTPRVTTGPVVQSFTDTRVDPGVTYYYMVRTLVPATAPAGRYRPSPWSQEAAATPGGSGGNARPVARADSATVRSASSARLFGAATPNGLQTFVQYQWGTSPSLAGAATTTLQGAGDGLSPVHAGAVVTGLTPGAQYYYRLIATNSAGADSSAILPLRLAPPAPPRVTGTFARPAYAVVLSWTAADADSVRVERRNGGVWSTLVDGSTGSTFTDATVPLEDEHLEYYRVTACNEVGCSAPTETFVRVQPLPVPANFGGVAAPNQVQLNWTTNGAPAVAFYQVRRRTAGTPYRPRVTTAAGVTAFADTNVHPDSTYFYQVRALLPTAGLPNRASAWSGVLTVSPSTAGATPSVTTGPLELNTAGRRVITGTVDVTSSGTSAFFEISDNPDLVPFTRIDVFLSSGASGPTKVFSTQTGRYYRVGATNAAGTVRGAIRSTVVPAPVLTAPRGVQGGFDGTNYTVQLRWEPVEGATSYLVERGSGPGLIRYFPRQPSLEDPRFGPAISQSFSYVVRACTEAGCGPAAEPVTVRTDPLVAPAGVEVQVLDIDRVAVRWDDRSTGEDGFFVLRRTLGQVHFTVVRREQREGVTEYVDTGLTPGTTYEYIVEGYVDTVHRRSLPSDIVQVTMPGS